MSCSTLLDGLLDGGERVGLGEFGRGDLPVEFGLGGLQVVESLLLRVLCAVGSCPRADASSAFHWLALGRVRAVGDLRSDLLGGLAGIAGGELGLGLLVGEFVAA